MTSNLILQLSRKKQLLKTCSQLHFVHCGVSTLNPRELTLAILKPDLVANPVDLEAVKVIIVQNNFEIVSHRRLLLSMREAQRFYAEHDGKFFFNRLVTYMTSGDIEVCVLSKDNAIRDWRELMGPTKVLKAIYEKPESIRGRFGLTDTRNATHGSDSVENAQKEILFFFPDFKFPSFTN